MRCGGRGLARATPQAGRGSSTSRTAPIEPSSHHALLPIAGQLHNRKLHDANASVMRRPRTTMLFNGWIGEEAYPESQDEVDDTVTRLPMKWRVVYDP